MKKAIASRLCIVILVSMFFIALLSYYFQVKSAQDTMLANSLIRISQVEQILDKNNLDIEHLKENMKEDYFIRAKAAAYIVQNQPEVVGNLGELKKIAALLQVDEFHLFDTEGKLFAGTEPKYFDYTFRSGEQMEFFLPMLSDYSLQLCQDVVPNTAEKKPMQYAAVWREDHKGIVQIGMEPTRLLEALEKNNLSHIFTMVTADKDISIFAADPETGMVLGATNNAISGRNLADFGIDWKAGEAAGGEWNIVMENVKSYCVLRPSKDLLIGVSSTHKSLYQNVASNMALILLGLFILSAAIVLLIVKTLDHLVVHGIHQMVCDMAKIAGGDLDRRINVTNLPEFAELSSNMNSMVVSLLETTGKLSLVFQNVNVPIAVYEYSPDMKRVLATNKIGDILALPEGEMAAALADQNVFRNEIRRACARPFPLEEDVFLVGEEDARYVKILSYQEERKTLGILVDVTETVLEKRQIMYERDIDLLTGLSSRRAFFCQMDCLFQHPEELKSAVLLMADTDNLKYVNDTWGHEFGDRLLSAAGGLLKECCAPGVLAARLSGDEFVLFLYHAESESILQDCLDRLCEKMQKTETTAQHQVIPVRLSGGYVFLPDAWTDYREMLRLADQTMYQAKKNKKGHFIKCCIPPKSGGREQA